MNNLILAYIIRFLKIPLFILFPFILCNILYGLFCRYIYNPLETNRIYIFVKSYEDNPIIKLLDSFLYKVYSIVSNIDILRQTLVIFLPANSIFFGVNFLYLLYFSTISIIATLLFLKKTNKHDMIIKNTNFFRSLANKHIEVKLLDIEIRLLVTDNIVWQLAQFSLFFSFGYIINPYIMEVYFVIFNNIVSLLPITFEKSMLSIFFIIFILQISLVINLFIAFLFFGILFKKNILIILFQKIIIKNFIQLKNIEKEKYGKNTNTLMRIAIFNDSKIKKYKK